MKQLYVFFTILTMALTVNAKNDARADIFFTNGSIIEGVELKLPASWYDKVEYTFEDKRHKIHADSIDHILLYHVDAPERKAYIRRNPVGEFDHKKNEVKDWKVKNWQFLESAGEHLLYWVAFWKVKVKKDKFSFTLGANERSYATPYYFQKTSSPISFNIPANPYRTGVTRDWLTVFLADDPEIVKHISEKGYFSKKQKDAMRHGGNDFNPFYYEDIAVDYTPVNK